MGGGHRVEENALFNSCRDSGVSNPPTPKLTILDSDIVEAPKEASIFSLDCCSRCLSASVRHVLIGDTLAFALLLQRLVFSVGCVSSLRPGPWAVQLVGQAALPDYSPQRHSVAHPRTQRVDKELRDGELQCKRRLLR